MHRSRGRVGLASRVLLTGLVETARFGVTGVIAIDRHTDTATVDIVIRFDGIVVTVPGAVVGVGEIGLAPRAVELTVLISVTSLREGKLTVGRDANDSLVAGFKVEEEPGVAARAGHVPAWSLPVISNFVPHSNSDWAVRSEGNGIIMALLVAIAQRYQILTVWVTTVASVLVSTVC